MNQQQDQIIDDAAVVVLTTAINISDCEQTRYACLAPRPAWSDGGTGDIHGDAIAYVIPGWLAEADGDKIYNRLADSAQEAAEEYVAGGEWGNSGGSIDVTAWRRAVTVDSDGAVVYLDLGRETITIGIPVDEEMLIADAMGDDGCGTGPDDHDWTGDGHGGCDENPGVWATGGTSIVITEHCWRCGLVRATHLTGSQRNPGDGDTVKYRQADSDEMDQWLAIGAMAE